MPRNRRDLAAAVLEEIIKAPNIAPSRLSGRAGVKYSYVKIFLQNRLIEVQKTGKRHAHPSMHACKRETEPFSKAYSYVGRSGSCRVL